jgi:hypothetical protein
MSVVKSLNNLKVLVAFSVFNINFTICSFIWHQRVFLVLPRLSTHYVILCNQNNVIPEALITKNPRSVISAIPSIAYHDAIGNMSVYTHSCVSTPFCTGAINVMISLIIGMAMSVTELLAMIWVSPHGATSASRSISILIRPLQFPSLSCAPQALSSGDTLTKVKLNFFPKIDSMSRANPAS